MHVDSGLELELEFINTRPASQHSYPSMTLQSISLPLGMDESNSVTQDIGVLGGRDGNVFTVTMSCHAAMSTLPLLAMPTQGLSD